MSLLNHPLTQHRILVPILVIVPIAYLASLPWLKASPDWLIFALGGVAVLIEVGGSFILFARKAMNGIAGRHALALNGAGWSVPALSPCFWFFHHFSRSFCHSLI